MKNSIANKIMSSALAATVPSSESKVPVQSTGEKGFVPPPRELKKPPAPPCVTPPSLPGSDACPGRVRRAGSGSKFLAATFLFLLSFGITCCPSVLAAQSQASSPPKKLEIFIAKGHDAVSDLDDPGPQKELTDTIFKGQGVTMNVSGEGKQKFLENLGKSDVAFISCHVAVKEEQMPIVIGSGERVYPGEIISHFRNNNSGGPRLVMVAGCITVTQDAVSLPNALGITSTTKGRVYIGWPTKIVGVAGDRQIMKFLRIFMTPDRAGKYPTIDEAQRASGASFVVIGDKDMRKTDLDHARVSSSKKGIWTIVCHDNCSKNVQVQIPGIKEDEPYIGGVTNRAITSAWDKRFMGGDNNTACGPVVIDKKSFQEN